MLDFILSLSPVGPPALVRRVSSFPCSLVPRPYSLTHLFPSSLSSLSFAADHRRHRVDGLPLRRRRRPDRPAAHALVPRHAPHFLEREWEYLGGREERGGWWGVDARIRGIYFWSGRERKRRGGRAASRERKRSERSAPFPFVRGSGQDQERERGKTSHLNMLTRKPDDIRFTSERKPPLPLLTAPRPARSTLPRPPRTHTSTRSCPPTSFPSQAIQIFTRVPLASTAISSNEMPGRMNVPKNEVHSS